MSQIVLVRPPAAGLIRVYGRHDDPFAPAPWALSFGPDGSLAPLRNRFDDIGPALGLPIDQCFRTVYAASSIQAALGELLAGRRPIPGMLERIDDRVTDRKSKGDVALDLDRTIRGVIPAEWRLRRRIATARLRANAWFIDVHHPMTLTYLRANFVPVMKQQFPQVVHDSDFDLSDVTSRNRLLTQHLARYLHELPINAFPQLTKDDAIAGIRYLSRHSPGCECWAIFADRLGNGLVVDLPREIDVDDPDLQAVAATFNLAIE